MWGEGKGMTSIFVVILKFNALLSLLVNIHLCTIQIQTLCISLPAIDSIKYLKSMCISPLLLDPY